MLQVGRLVCDFYQKTLCAIFLEATLPDFHFPVQQFPGEGKRILASVHAGNKTNRHAYLSSIRLYTGLLNASELVHSQSSKKQG